MSVRNLLQNKFSQRLFCFLEKLRDGLRELSGDDAYERYLAHWQEHQHDSQPLDRKSFYHLQQQQKWSGITRCC